MKARAKMTAALAAAAVLVTAGAAWAVPTVSNVSMTQRQGTRLVDITYDLDAEDAIVTLAIETNNVALPDSAVTWLTGDVNKVVTLGAGRKSIVWDAGADWPENLTEIVKPKLTAWSTNAPPQVMVIDLAGGKDATNYPVAYYASTEALPGGVTNLIYKSAYLVMRKIIKGHFSMGEGSVLVPVTLTKDFYTGVYQVTQKQWYNVMGSTPVANFTDNTSRAFRPMEKVSYNDIRGKRSDTPPIDWPTTGQAVSEGSFLGKLRSKTGLQAFDLPTEAQWEYACRAGTISYYNDGYHDGLTGTPNTESNAQMAVLGRYKHNGGRIWNGTVYVDAPAASSYELGTAIVGSYLPNAWGLYDMHGNVNEWCLDWYGATLTGGEDPVGPIAHVSEKPSRIHQGGCWYYDAGSCRLAYRLQNIESFQHFSTGFRLVATLP